MLSIRLAVEGDMPVLTALMNLAIGALLKPFLTPDQVRGSYEIISAHPCVIASAAKQPR
jgi:hypothetical protein